MNKNIFTPTLSIVVASLSLLSACAPPPAPTAAPAAEKSRTEIQKAGTQPSEQKQEVVKSVIQEAPKPTEAPATSNRAVAPAPPASQELQDHSQKVAPYATQAPQTIYPQGGVAPKPIVIGGDRIPIEPTSVAQPIAPTPFDTTFKDYGVNPFIDARNDRFSTFSLDVDTASYAVARKYVNDGLLPPYQAIRAEEFINYFAQDYAPPTNNAFAIYADGAPSPFHRDGSHIVRVGVQGYEIPAAQRKPASLTFVIDVSGSMNLENRLGLVKRSLQVLVDRLRRDDSVSIVVYGSTARVVLYPTSGDRKDEILNAIYALHPEGSTNTEAGMQLGYQMAANSHIPNGINRVILCSDGVANVGNTEPVSLIASVKGHAPDDVMLTTIGFGMDNFNDVLMEQLADKGNGFYAYVDTIEEAQKMFIDRLTNSLETIAKDAKTQVEFNPDVVERYRLIGYENRAVADADFRNESVDAGELNAGHNATALYAVQLRPKAQGKIATVFLRWQDPTTRQTQELAGEISTWDIAPSFNQTSARYQMNVIVAEYAEILRRSPYSEMTLSALSGYATQIARQLPDDADAQEFAQLVQRASLLR